MKGHMTENSVQMQHCKCNFAQDTNQVHTLFLMMNVMVEGISVLYEILKDNWNSFYRMLEDENDTILSTK